LDSYIVSLLDRMKEQYEQWESSSSLDGAELTQFFDAIGRAAKVTGRDDLAAEVERILRRMNRQKERQWTVEEVLAEMFPLLRRCYEAEETDSTIASFLQQQGAEADILLCGNDPLFFAYIRRSWQTVPWRFITLPSLEQAAASMFRLNPDCIIVNIGEDDLETPPFVALLKTASQPSYIPVVIISRDGRKAVHLKCYGLGADDVIAQPVAASELYIRVHRLVEKKRKIDKLVLIDELTGVYNRKYLPRVYVRLRSDLERFGTPSCLALLDLDHFKQVNDRFGHLVGDAVLKKLAAFLLQHTRGMDTVIRFGGEEFIVWLAKTSTCEAHRVLGRLQRQFASEEIEAAGVRLSCTFSAGFVECSDPNESLDHWLKLADKALYAAKKSGGSRVEGV
jgi:two-component system, cell cycle response regulator